MNHFRRILYVSHASEQETAGMMQALQVARHNQAPMHIAIVAPAFPNDIPQYQQKYEAALRQQVERNLEATMATLAIAPESIPVDIAFEIGKAPANRLIQRILNHSYDIIIKEAEQCQHKSGFKALDMDLLRKCPVPLWLCRPIDKPRSKVNVAVAIDPENQETTARNLSVRLLELARSLADTATGELSIVSCWEYAFEHYLRHNAWVPAAESDIGSKVAEAQANHRAELDKLIEAAGLQGRYRVYHERGEADDVIPDFVKQRDINILVMGTLARTGIPGFVIGNTAENILQHLNCSLVALKPSDFVSPVKAH